jgi:hypothetical protein
MKFQITDTLTKIQYFRELKQDDYFEVDLPAEFTSEDIK